MNIKGKITKKNILVMLFVIVLSISFLATCQRGEVIVDENGYADSFLNTLQYKYKPEWNRIPTETSATMYIKNEENVNELILTIYAFPLKLLQATPENAYDVIAQTYKDAYDVFDETELTIDDRKAVMLNYYSDEEKFGGRIYIIVNDNVGYSIMCTEQMDEPTYMDNDIVDEFISYIHF